MNRIHTILHYFVGDLYLILQGGRTFVDRPPEETLDGLKREIAAYEALERAQGGDEARQELARLEDLKSMVARLETDSLKAMEASARGRPPAPAELADLNELAYERVSGIIAELHALHRTKFQRAIDESQQRMFLISALYVAFAVGGALLLFLGNRFLFRTLVLPITRLAQAALHISDRDLSQRVPVRSGDEIGQLSRAFNLMADRLEAHEAERLSFQAELERQVKQRTRELEETTARLQTTQSELVRSERVAVTGQIAAGVTHEIRTPLNSLAINLQLLRRELSGSAAPPPIHEVLDGLTVLEYEVTRINGILEEFVAFARLPTPRFAEVEVVPLIDEVLTFLGPQAAGGDVRLGRPPVAPGAIVRGDRDQLRQVLLNLTQNALQAMPDGGILAVEVSDDGEQVKIAVTDSGAGVPEAQRELIFLP
ncbi:MAG: HAMP domain-containing protein, partial [Candidatus Rokubacteria bacterium]|nr:HAMP domain-containing protein [Candidatus Rokubacteria bacterium]